MSDEIEYKTCFDTQMELKDGNSGNGIVTGYFAVFEKEDREKDIIHFGAFKDTIPQLLRDGEVRARHGRVSMGGVPGVTQPIATISDVKETEYGALYVAEYHSTDFAQQERTIAKERLARGKSVGNSFGYRVPKDGAEYKAGGGRHLRRLDVFEITTNTHMPANPLALTHSVKDFFSLHDGLTMAEQKEQALAAAQFMEEYVARVEDLWGLREKEGRRFSRASLEEMRQVHEAMHAAHGAMGGGMGRLKQLLDAALPPDNEDGGKSEDDIQALALKEYARFNALKLGLVAVAE